MDRQQNTQYNSNTITMILIRICKRYSFFRTSFTTDISIQKKHNSQIRSYGGTMFILTMILIAILVISWEAKDSRKLHRNDSILRWKSLYLPSMEGQNLESKYVFNISVISLYLNICVFCDEHDVGFK
jgi:hypothetical protein